MPDQFAEAECPVRALSAERTFWEKATILHVEYHRGGGKSPGERQTRHYYDLVKLYESPAGKNALEQIDLLEAVVKHKRLFFRSAWAHYEEAKPGSFRLVPPNMRLTHLKVDYAEMHQVMIFGDSPSFESDARNACRLGVGDQLARQEALAAAKDPAAGGPGPSGRRAGSRSDSVPRSRSPVNEMAIRRGDDGDQGGRALAWCVAGVLS